MGTTIYVAICNDDIISKRSHARKCRIISLDSMTLQEAKKIVNEMHPARNWTVFPSSVFEA